MSPRYPADRFVLHSEAWGTDPSDIWQWSLRVEERGNDGPIAYLQGDGMETESIPLDHAGLLVLRAAVDAALAIVPPSEETP